MGGEESKEKLLAGKGRREKGQREERKVEECVLLSLQPVLYHMKPCTVLSSVAMVTRSFDFSGSRDFVRVNYQLLQFIQYSDIAIMSICHHSLCMCIHVCTITMLPVTVSCRYKNLATPLDGMHVRIP